jgi:hypothetical protein
MTAILAAILVLGVLVVLVAYSLQTFPAPTTVTSTRTVMISGSNSAVTVSGRVTTTTVLGQVQLRSGVGSQALLCSWASYFVPDTVTTTNGSAPTQTYSVVKNYTTTIFTESGGPVTTTQLGVYASATNATQSVGYIVTTTTTPNYGMSYGWIVTTCTYLP